MDGLQFICDPSACPKKLFADDVDYKVDVNNYANKDAEMSEDIEPGDEATSAWNPSPLSLIATEDQSDYDPT